MDEIKSVGELMGRFQVKKTTGGINSQFNDAVDQIMKAIPDQGWTFPRWCGYLKNIPADDLLSMLSSAKKARNPGAKMNWLVKQWRVDNR